MDITEQPTSITTGKIQKNNKTGLIYLKLNLIKIIIAKTNMPRICRMHQQKTAFGYATVTPITANMNSRRTRAIPVAVKAWISVQASQNIQESKVVRFGRPTKMYSLEVMLTKIRRRNCTIISMCFKGIRTSLLFVIL